MIRRFFLVVGLMALTFLQTIGQQITGTVHELDSQGNQTPLPYANVFWAGTTAGVTTSEDGKFSIKRVDKSNNKLVISFVGYLADTVEVKPGQRSVNIVLNNNIVLNEVEVKERNKGTNISTLSPVSTQVISSEGIQRLACCSLADCFVNNSTVDVGFSDAVSGAKQIQMLGLAGVYSQLLVENQPSMRILATTYGLNFIPGPWLNAISISKGASSVVNGYESITGQINIDLKKPESSEKFYLDLFTNDYLRIEVNTNGSFKPSKNLSSIVLFNVSSTYRRIDRNDDGFMDVPLTTMITGSNRYFYNLKGKIRSRFGFDILWEDRVGGQTGFEKATQEGTTQQYGITLTTKRIHLFENTGFAVNPDRNSSIGINAGFTYHDQQSMFGLTRYNATQLSGSLNALMMSDIVNNKHKISAGVSLLYDHLEETLKDTTMVREEIVPGAFTEYTFNDHKKWTVLAGLRIDYNNLYGVGFNPRTHIKFTPWPHTTMRVSAGHGIRTANVIPEHIGLLASSRKFIYDEIPGQEKAWNYGIGFVQKITFRNKGKATFSIDFFRTDFQNQVVVDVDQNPEAVHIYNLQGPSYSNSFQTDFIIEPIKRFEITLAYRYNDVEMTVNNELSELPLTPKNRALLALHYSTKYEKWKFSFTTQYFGKTRLPDTQQNPVEYRLPVNSPDYFLFYAQITLKFSKFETFIGCENITDYKQTDPILAADDPFGKYFDTSIIYAPILGRQFNFGLRFKLD